MMRKNEKRKMLVVDENYNNAVVERQKKMRNAKTGDRKRDT